MADKKRDEVVPGKKWEFNEDVTDVFDDMLERSIPQYQVMRDAVYRIGRRHQQDNTDIVDLGCSRGEAVSPFIEEFGAHNTYWLCEVSKPMLAAVTSRFQGYVDAGIVKPRGEDLREWFPPVRASIILSVLTMMFIPIERRQRLIQDTYDHLMSEGALILVEKVLGSTARLDQLMVDLYYDQKRANGYTEDQIERKRLSLQGILVPVTASWNEELLRMAGFREVDCFWRWMNFAAWIAIK